MISFQIKPWVAFGFPYLLIELFYIGMPVVRTDGRSRSLARCTVTRLPNFLGWYHISLAMGLRPRARFARGAPLLMFSNFARLLKDSWIRNSLWKNVSLGELLPFFKKCLVFIQSTCVVTKHVGDKNLLWGSPEALSGAGISPIWSSGFGILKKIRGRDRDWNYAREVGYQK